MKRNDRRIVLLVAVSAAMLALALMAMGFLFFPRRSWVAVRNFTPLLLIGMTLASCFGFLIARFLLLRGHAGVEAREQHMRLFLAETGHELRTPIATLMGSVTLLEKSVPVDDIAGRTLLDGMTSELTRLARSVQNLLIFARLERLSPGERMVQVDMAAVAREIADEASRRAPKPDIQVNVSGTLIAIADPVSLREAIRNLIDNALRYGVEPIQLNLKERGALVSIEVIDCGAGIDPDELTLVREPHYRGMNGLSLPGSGLGLSIVEKFAEAHRGSLHLENHSHGFRATLSFLNQNPTLL